MSQNNDMICIYSKYSSHCQKFLKDVKKINNVKMICIDNKDIRDFVLKSQRILIRQVPAILLKTKKDTELYEGDDAFNKVAMIIENNKREELEKRMKSEREIKKTLEDYYEEENEKNERSRQRTFKETLSSHRQKIENEFKRRQDKMVEDVRTNYEREKQQLIEQFEEERQQILSKNEMGSNSNTRTVIEDNNLDYDEFAQRRERHQEMLQNNEMQMLKAQKQLTESQDKQNQMNNSSLRGHSDMSDRQIVRSRERENVMKSKTGHELTSLEDVLERDQQSEAMQNTIDSSINKGGGTDIMALAQQMQNSREDPDSQKR